MEINKVGLIDLLASIFDGHIPQSTNKERAEAFLMTLDNLGFEIKIKEDSLL